MKLRISVTSIKTDRLVREDASHLRGYIGNRFKGNILLHQHPDDGEILYAYPRVQYKIIDGNPLIIALEDGVEAVRDILGALDRLELSKSVYRVESVSTTEREVEVGASREPLDYEFITSWLALNQRNYEKYRGTESWALRKALLNSVLVGNILSFSKAFGYYVKPVLRVRSILNEERVRFKGLNVIGFKGRFSIGFRLPDLIGLGKGASQGFGTIKLRKRVEK